MDKRILELALQTLEKRKAAIDTEIQLMQTRLKGGARPNNCCSCRRETESQKRCPTQSSKRKNEEDLGSEKGCEEGGSAKAEEGAKECRSEEGAERTDEGVLGEEKGGKSRETQIRQIGATSESRFPDMRHSAISTKYSLRPI